MKTSRKKIKPIDPNFKNHIDKILSGLKDSLSELYDYAVRDEKTGTYNYRFFKNIFELEIEKAKRGKQKLSLIVIDIDFFKKLNDTFGHLTGDKVLYELSANLTKGLRKYDILARFGGEEFFILLPGSSSIQAKKVAQRLRKNLWKNKTLKKYEVTISLGVSQYKEKDSMQKLIKRSDKALYKAKKDGRDCIRTL